MATRRKNTYYVQRRFAGVGKLYRSLHTDRKGLADARENMLAAIHQQGHYELSEPLPTANRQSNGSRSTSAPVVSLSW